ncbi:MAG: SPFH domain-containing protein [Deltaproteobacteria bacterium]|nr:SPFH domain-containing protein [Deltaproteobacteria bacterium]
MKKKITAVSFIIISAAAIFGSGTYFVNPGNIAVITRAGKIISEPKSAGLHFRIPFIQEVNHINISSLQTWDGSEQLIPTHDKTLISVNTTVAWKISDPVVYFRTLNNLDSTKEYFNKILPDIEKEIVSSSYFNEIVDTNTLARVPYAIANENTTKQLFNLISEKTMEFGIRPSKVQVEIKFEFDPDNIPYGIGPC